MSNRRRPRTATRDRLDNRLIEVGQRLGFHPYRNHEPSAWLRGRLANINHRAAAGQVAHCGHVEPGAVGALVLWRDDLVCCGGCAEWLRLTGDPDRTCDRCDAVVPLIHPTSVTAGPTLIVGFGLCPDCHRKEVGR